MRHFAVLFALAMVSPIWAGSLQFDNNWREQKFPLKPAVEYRKQGNGLEIKAQSAASFLYRALPQELWDAKNAGWQWNVRSSVPPTNLANKGGDDRNMAIYFVFVPSEQAQAMQGSSLTKILRNPSTKALVYTYGGQQGRGSVLKNPYLAGRGVTIVKRSAGTGAFSERVDLRADFKSAFGHSANELIGIGVSADSDDTKSKIDANLGSFALD